MPIASLPRGPLRDPAWLESSGTAPSCSRALGSLGGPGVSIVGVPRGSIVRPRTPPEGLRGDPDTLTDTHAPNLKDIVQVPEKCSLQGGYTPRMDVLQGLAWLFVRSDESIRVTRDSTGLVLLVCGPGSAEHSHHFDSEASLEDFRAWYEQRLDSEGWALKGVVERRVTVDRSDVPQSSERRRGHRPI